jgi:hypothetical protein
MGDPNLDHRLKALTSPAEAYLLSAGAHTIGERRMHFFWCYSLSHLEVAGDVHLRRREQAMEDHYDTSTAPIFCTS